MVQSAAIAGRVHGVRPAGCDGTDDAVPADAAGGDPGGYGVPAGTGVWARGLETGDVKSMTTLRKRIADRSADDHRDAVSPDRDEDGMSASEPLPAKRLDRVGKSALIWPWHIKPGQHIRPVVLEAMEVLKSEGWVVGRITDPDLPFDLIGILDRAAIFVKAVRAKCSVTNAKETAKAYCREIKRMQPFWNSDGDNLQFWVFSRVAGLLRYRVFRGGIWNEATRSKPDLREPLLEPLSRRMRSAA